MQDTPQHTHSQQPEYDPPVTVNIDGQTFSIMNDEIAGYIRTLNEYYEMEKQLNLPDNRPCSLSAYRRYHNSHCPVMAPEWFEDIDCCDTDDKLGWITDSYLDHWYVLVDGLKEWTDEESFRDS